MFNDIIDPLSGVTMTGTVHPMRWLRSSALVLTLAVLATACSDSGTETPTTTPSTSAETTTSAAASTTTTSTSAPTTITSTTTTTTALPRDAVGDPFLLAEVVELAIEEARIGYEDPTITVDVPDLTNADPLAALGALTAFSQRVFANFPLRTWATVTEFPGSPSDEVARSTADSSYFDGLVRTRTGDPFEYDTMEVVEITTLDLPQETLEGMPQDAVAILTTSNSGPLVLATLETDEVVETLSEGWTDRPILTILVPTEAGWREWDTILDFGGTA